MADLEDLKSLFKDCVYVIPDYQRGYIWDMQQLAEFWEDLRNIDKMPHYMGVLSIKENEQESENKVYEVIDGQQRLTTCIILIQSIIEFAEDNFKRDDNDNEIYFSDFDSTIGDIKKEFLYKTNRVTNQRKYKFQYSCDKDSELCFNHTILNEPNTPKLKTTLYTKKLEGAKSYFKERLKELYGDNENENEIKKLYFKLVNKLEFNKFVIEKDFDTNVAFESMNNRGKKLSTLELLKNRLLFLSTIMSDNEKDINDTKAAIVKAWAEIYEQLGRSNNDKELLDDDFLKTHWIFYWGYSRKKGDDYKEFLLNKQFVRKNVYENLASLQTSQYSEYGEPEDDEDENEISTSNDKKTEPLTLKTINSYTASLRSCVSCWVDSYYPPKSRYSQDIVDYLDKFNRIGAGAHFRPLITVALKKCIDKYLSEKVLSDLLKTIERFVFIVFALNQSRRNSYDAKFYNYSKDLYYEDNDVTSKVEIIIAEMDKILKEDCFTDKEKKMDESFTKYIQKQFRDKKGFYSWDKIRYFLSEYEMKLAEDKKRNEILSYEKDNTIEHIYPQEDSDKYWVDRFGSFNDEQKKRYKNAIGNLLLLSKSINSSLQNYSFVLKSGKKDDIKNLRTTYKDGSYSEREVADKPEWTPIQIKKRSENLINFMEEQWEIEFSENCKKYLTDPTQPFSSQEK